MVVCERVHFFLTLPPAHPVDLCTQQHRSREENILEVQAVSKRTKKKWEENKSGENMVGWDGSLRFRWGNNNGTKIRARGGRRRVVEEMAIFCLCVGEKCGAKDPIHQICTSLRMYEECLVVFAASWRRWESTPLDLSSN